MTGNPEDIRALSFRWFQGRGYLTPLRLYSCRFLECKLLGEVQIAGIIESIPGIVEYRWIN